ncbi:o-succinylbenzoate--CoA ligase [Cellulomonas carbonis]|nr:o-succinylbenzoate--CoA ligase [Cellulomonas carbonis]GGC09228.1 O-succinylbenzoic acid--CoA ligase [Cellulomonas carbonis]
MDLPLVPLPVGPTDRATADRVAEALHVALTGGPAVLPHPVGEAPDDASRVPDGVALVVRTSGSTGRPRGVLLDGAALRASADATHARLGGPGRWVLSLPLVHVAGLQVLVRSLVAGLDPVVGPPGPFDGGSWLRSVADAPSGAPLHGSLVPTQLHRVVAAAEDDAGLAAAARVRLSAVLLGGAATPGPLRARATALGLPVVRTYGMTETSGGCVYDGVPLDGVSVRLVDGAVELAGPVLARGYLGRPDLDAAAFEHDGGRRWFRTQDVGSVDAGGRLAVLGRRDDVLVTGGAKVAPTAVEGEVATLDGVGEVCVVGVPDPEWGQAVTAVVVVGTSGRTPSLEEVRAHVARTLGAAAAPRHLVLVDALPLRGPGKVDRAEVARLAAAEVARDGRTGADGRPGAEHR